MLSTKLKQITQLQLDSASMRGPVNRSDIAVRVYELVHDSEEFWSLADKRAALEGYIRDGIAELMDERISEDYLRAHLGHVPRQYLYLLEKLPRYICINAAKGLHVLATKATRDDWADSAKIKRKIANHITTKANDDEDVFRVLSDAGVETIEELSLREAA